MECKQKFGRGTRTKLKNLNCCVNTPLRLSNSYLVVLRVLSTHLIQGETEGNLLVLPSENCWAELLGSSQPCCYRCGGTCHWQPKATHDPGHYSPGFLQSNLEALRRKVGVTQSKAKHGRAVVEAAVSCLLEAGPWQGCLPLGAHFGAGSGQAMGKESPRQPQCNFPVAPQPV